MLFLCKRVRIQIHFYYLAEFKINKQTYPNFCKIIEFSNKKELKKVIEKAYFEEGYLGKLLTKNNFVEVTPEVDDILYTVVKGLNNATIKITNNDLIDGSCRFIVDDTGDNPKLFPISMYCIVDDNKKYIFY